MNAKQWYQRRGTWVRGAALVAAALIVAFRLREHERRRWTCVAASSSPFLSLFYGIHPGRRRRSSCPSGPALQCLHSRGRHFLIFPSSAFQFLLPRNPKSPLHYLINGFYLNWRYLHPEPYPEENLEFLRSRNIRLLQFGIKGKTEPSVASLKEAIKALKILIGS